VAQFLDSGDAQHGPDDVVVFGRPARRERRLLRSLLLTCVVVAAVGLVVARSADRPRRPPAPPPVSVTSIGHPILGVHAGWQLFGLTNSGLVAVQFARGRVVRTAMPRLESDGPIFLVAARSETIVRPLDNVPGYAVPDGKPARLLTGALAQGGTMLPGPAPGEVWLVGDGLTLVGPDGRREQPHLPVPPQLLAAPNQVISDGHGGLIVIGASGGVYDATPGELRRIDALPLAVGPRQWLALQCGHASCSDVVISTSTGASRLLAGPTGPAYPWPWQALPGVVSPDGKTAAVIVISQPGVAARLDLISLTTGAVTEVPVQVAQAALSQSLAWSPDSRWLFVVTAHGGLAAVDPRTGLPRDLRLGLSGLSQIVIGPAG
jgi:hypothetical protein